MTDLNIENVNELIAECLLKDDCVYCIIPHSRASSYLWANYILANYENDIKEVKHFDDAYDFELIFNTGSTIDVIHYHKKLKLTKDYSKVLRDRR